MGFYSDFLPYACVYIDATWREFLKAAQLCSVGSIDRGEVTARLQDLWVTQRNPNHVLPCLSVRTGLDLYLRECNFPPGSEVIMSAINIPDVMQLVHHHGLKIVALDVCIETAAPKVEHISHLVTDKTVAIVIAHVYGKWCNMDPVIAEAKKYNLKVIEDCAEAFCGLQEVGHPETDVALFSFGVIKNYTAFGGAIAKIKDLNMYENMSKLYATYSLQSHMEYLKKVMKYSVLYLILNKPCVGRAFVFTGLALGVDHKSYMVKMLRGFPNQLVAKIRQQPCDAMLKMMLERMQSFSLHEYSKRKTKADFVGARLPEGVGQVGTKAHINNQWLFPIVVDNPDLMVKALNNLGVDAYRGATQLTVVESDDCTVECSDLKTFTTRYPHEAKFLIDHVIYLPVHKHVPFYELEKICQLVDVALRETGDKSVFAAADHGKLSSKL